MSAPDNPFIYPSDGEPSQTHSGPNGIFVTSGTGPHRGMTLRDYFAGQALCFLEVKDVMGAARDAGIPAQQFIAGLAYQLADAMLAKRSKP